MRLYDDATRYRSTQLTKLVRSLGYSTCTPIQFDKWVDRFRVDCREALSGDEDDNDEKFVAIEGNRSAIAANQPHTAGPYAHGRLADEPWLCQIAEAKSLGADRCTSISGTETEEKIIKVYVMWQDRRNGRAYQQGLLIQEPPGKFGLGFDRYRECTWFGTH